MNQLHEAQYRWVVEYLEGISKLQGAFITPQLLAKEIVDNLERIEVEDMLRHFHGDEVEATPFDV